MCVASAGSNLRSVGNNDSVVAEMVLSRVLSRATGPLIPISQSGRGCWEQAVLGNDLAGGLRDGEGRDGRAHKGQIEESKRGDGKGRMDQAGSQRVLMAGKI